MRISVKAKPKSSKEYIKKIGEASFEVAIKEMPEKGKANQAIIKALAEFLNIPASFISLVSGQTSKRKVFEVPLVLEDLENLPFSSGQIKLL